MKQALLDQTIELLRYTEMWPHLDIHKVVEAAWLVNCGYKPFEAMTEFNSERIAWLMDDRSQWLSKPPRAEGLDKTGKRD